MTSSWPVTKNGELLWHFCIVVWAEREEHVEDCLVVDILIWYDSLSFTNQIWKEMRYTKFQEWYC